MFSKWVAIDLQRNHSVLWLLLQKRIYYLPILFEINIKYLNNTKKPLKYSRTHAEFIL